MVAHPAPGESVCGDGWAVSSTDSAMSLLVADGVGNIAAAIVGPAGGQGMVSMNGIVGGQARSMRSFEHVWPVGTLLIMHSDGLASRWSLDDHPGLARKDPAVIAAVLARDHARGRDDVAVLVARRETRR